MWRAKLAETAERGTGEAIGKTERDAAIGDAIDLLFRSRAVARFLINDHVAIALAREAAGNLIAENPQRPARIRRGGDLPRLIDVCDFHEAPPQLATNVTSQPLWAAAAESRSRT